MLIEVTDRTYGELLVDRNSRMRSIRRPRRPGALQALMAASGAPASLVTHRQMGSSLRHPILATDHLDRRPSGLRPAPPPAVTVHLVDRFRVLDGSSPTRI